jgi:fucose 4-O-acetylase-like acetyltransferase
LAKILNDISKKVNLKQWVVIVISFIILLYGYSLYKNKITYPYMFDLSFVSLFYFLAGNYFKNKNIFVTKINHLYAIPISIVIIFFFTNLHFVGVNWPTRSFSNPLINIVVSFSGIYLTYILSIALSKIKYAKVPLTYIGMRTMTVLTMHFLAFRVCFILFFLLGMTDYSQLQSLVPIPNNNHWVILTILSAGIVLMIDYIVQLNPYMNYFLFGRNNDKVNQKVKQVFIEEDVV